MLESLPGGQYCPLPLDLIGLSLLILYSLDKPHHGMFTVQVIFETKTVKILRLLSVMFKSKGDGAGQWIFDYYTLIDYNRNSIAKAAG